MTDALTQLSNRRAVEFELRREISLGRRFGTPLSTGDLPARIGGDEFMLLLPRTTKPNAIRVAEKLRQRLEQISFVDDIQVSVSIGVASMPDDGEAEDALLAAVDQAMYRAKQAGGRGVAFSS
ncbi:MAG TPA: GGDEF domain-containing protein [bacterium]|nr:GGDEF domain-containing protein [bacterium]